MDILGIVITVVLGVGAIIVSLVIARHQAEFVAVDYEVDSDVSLWQADADDEMASRIHLRYEDCELQHPRFIDVTVTNTGTKPVRAEDYDRPIVFELAGNIAPVDARVTSQYPDDIVDEIFVTQANGVRAIAITPRLLNPGYWFKLRMLFDHDDAKLEASHRIAGAGTMREYSVDRSRTEIRVMSRPTLISYLLGFVIGAVVMVKLTLHDIHAGHVGSPVFALIAGPLMGGVLGGTVAAISVIVVLATYLKFFYH
jgi:hypothetical protein